MGVDGLSGPYHNRVQKTIHGVDGQGVVVLQNNRVSP